MIYFCKSHISRVAARCVAVLAVALLVSVFPLRPAAASSSFGTLSNFDVFNDTGQECHGFEIELEGVSSSDVTYTFGAPYERYGNPKIEDKKDVHGNVVGVYIRYESPYDAAAQRFTQATPQPPNLLAAPPRPITATDGHACYAGGPITSTGVTYENSGCEHFGVGVRGNPTNTVYRWLVADPNTPGRLLTLDTKVSIPAPVWNVLPPPNPAVNANPVVRAAIAAEPQEQWACARFGEAQWVKIYKTEVPHHVQLENLLTDDPDVPQDIAETEIEWQILQAQPTCDENGAPAVVENELANEDQLGEGNESVIRRYEFYKYTGAYDAENHEAMPINDTNPLDANGDSNGDLGDYIGAQMAAVNLLQPLAVVSTPLPEGEKGMPYMASLVHGGVPPYIISVTSGKLPAGLTRDPATGVLSGTPTQVGAFSFTLDVTDASDPLQVASAPVTMHIANVVRINTLSLPSGTSGQLYSTKLQAGRGVSPYTWSLVAGKLPSGLKLKLGGAITGKPKKSGTFALTFEVTDSAGATAQQALSLTIAAASAPAPIPPPAPAPGTTKVEGKGIITALGNNSIKVGAVHVYYNSSTAVKFNDVPGYAVGLPAEYTGYKDAQGVITATALEIN